MAYLEFKSEDQVTKYIREQELATSQKFVILNKDKSFGQKDAQPLEGKKLSWENKSIPLFSGVPFQIVGTKTYECHQGKDRKTRAKEKYAAEVKKKALEEHAIVKRRKLLVNTKKVDCKAMINIAHVIRFPDFKVNESTVRSKTEASRTLKKTLSEMPSSVRSEVVYCVRFPTLSEHSSHPVVGEEAYVRETVDVRVKEKIEQLTLSGVRKVTEIKRNLNFFIEEELFHGEQPPPHSRRRYYPTDSDIRNVMFKTKTTRESVVQHKHSSSGQQGGGPERTSGEVLRMQCAAYLKEITDLIDRLQDDQYMTELSDHLLNLLQDVKAHIPQDQGLTMTLSPGNIYLQILPTKTAAQPYNLTILPTKTAAQPYNVTILPTKTAAQPYNVTILPNKKATQPYNLTILPTKTTAQPYNVTILPTETVAQPYTDSIGHDTTAAQPYIDSIGHDTRAAPLYTDSIGHDTTAAPLYTDSIGHDTTAAQPHTDCIGHDTTAAQPHTDYIGHDTTVAQPYTDSMQHDMTAAPLYTDSIGHDTTVAQPYTDSIGHDTTVAQPYTDSIGHDTTAAHPHTDSRGHDTTAAHPHTECIGHDTTAAYTHKDCLEKSYDMTVD